MSGPPPPIHHASLEVTAEGQAGEVRFWEVLGFRQVEPPKGLAGGGTVWLERDGFQVHLVAVEQPVVPPTGHLALVEPELERVTDALVEAGFKSVPAAPHWGEARVKASSPAGHLVELMAGPPC
ncbi:MAG: VOC family protein [Solirubrobacterales bacterium]